MSIHFFAFFRFFCRKRDSVCRIPRHINEGILSRNLPEPSKNVEFQKGRQISRCAVDNRFETTYNQIQSEEGKSSAFLSSPREPGQVKTGGKSGANMAPELRRRIMSLRRAVPLQAVPMSVGHEKQAGWYRVSPRPSQRCVGRFILGHNRIEREGFD